MLPFVSVLCIFLCTILELRFPFLSQKTPRNFTKETQLLCEGRKTKIKGIKAQAFTEWIHF